jgi:hypothetical protein
MLRDDQPGARVGVLNLAALNVMDLDPSEHVLSAARREPSLGDRE